GDYARKINDYLSNDNSSKAKIVIVVKYGRYKIWRGYVVILASILCLETENSWFYMSCRKCNKMVTTRSEVFDLDGDEAVACLLQELMQCGAKHAKHTHNLLSLGSRSKLE
ncbi:hypothetical protein Tco_0618484, partial [Tanacetum coccineum]